MTADTSMHFQDSFARILHVAAHFQYNQYQRNNSRCMLAVSGMVYDKVKFLDLRVARLFLDTGSCLTKI